MTNSNKVVALTTIDNPFDPFDQFDQWLSYDEAKGYHSCAYLARIAKTAESFSDEDQEAEIERAIDEIVKLNLSGVHKKVTRHY